MRSRIAGRAIMVSALLLGLGACATFSRPQPAPLSVKVGEADETTLADARRLFGEGNTGLAFVRIQAYLAANPGSASGHNLAGAIFDRLGRFDLAERHYEKALSLQGGYLAALNNYGLSKLQRARATGRLDLEQDAEVLLSQALELSADPVTLGASHEALRAVLAPRKPVEVAPPMVPRRQPTVWLERRSESYSFLVTRPVQPWPVLADLEIDPALAFVSPGATLKTTRIALAPTRARRIRMWSSIGDAAPRLFGATSGLSILTLRPLKKPAWYQRLASISAAAALNARTAIFKLARLP